MKLHIEWYHSLTGLKNHIEALRKKILFNLMPLINSHDKSGCISGILHCTKLNLTPFHMSHDGNLDGIYVYERSSKYKMVKFYRQYAPGFAGKNDNADSSLHIW